MCMIIFENKITVLFRGKKRHIKQNSLNQSHKGFNNQWLNVSITAFHSENSPVNENQTLAYLQG